MPLVPLDGSKNFQILGNVCTSGRSWGSGNRVSAHRSAAKASHTSNIAASFSSRVTVGLSFIASYASIAAIMRALDSGVHTRLPSPLLPGAVPLPEPPGLFLEFQKRIFSSARQLL